ncbi:MAG: M23 family metallopeptidase [Bacteroidales bacterium]
MRFKGIKFITLLVMFVVLQSWVAYGQSSLLNTQKHHAIMQNDLISYNKMIPKIMNVVDSSLVMKQLRNEATEFPAGDLYAEDWDDQWKETYSAGAIPDTFAIDVSTYCMPVTGYKTSDYGWRWHRMHRGVDLKLQVGDTVRATFSGKIRKTAYEAKGYGYYVLVRHSNGLETVYGHLSKILVRPNQIVNVGDPIALGGNTGRSTGPHLHFETRFLGIAIDPNEIFDFANLVPHTDTYMFYAKKQQKTAVNSYATHRIKSGETLSLVASKYRTSITKLCKLNGITTRKVLKVGSVLKVR